MNQWIWHSQKCLDFCVIFNCARASDSIQEKKKKKYHHCQTFYGTLWSSMLFAVMFYVFFVNHSIRWVIVFEKVQYSKIIFLELFLLFFLCPKFQLISVSKVHLVTLQRDNYGSGLCSNVQSFSFRRFERGKNMHRTPLLWWEILWYLHINHW